MDFTKDELKNMLNYIRHELEYSAYNLCKPENRIEKLDERMCETTCPEQTLSLAIREIDRIKNGL